METYASVQHIIILAYFILKGVACQVSGTGPVFILEPSTFARYLNSQGTVLNCLVHGDPEPTVSWRTSSGDEVSSVPNFLNILKNNSLHFTPFSAEDYRQYIHANAYRCRASNKYGAIVSNVVRVKALVDQQYSTQVYDEYVIEGNTAVFKCHIPSYVKDFVKVVGWIRNDHFTIPKQVNKGNRFYLTNTGNLHISGISHGEDSNSVYKCQTKHIVSGKTTISSQGGKLHVTALSSSIPPKINDFIANVLVKSGENIILPCVAHAYPRPSYSWCRRNDVSGTCEEIDMDKKQNWEHMNDGTLLISFGRNDTGTYICRAVNEMGQEEAVTKVTVFSPISVFLHPQAQKVNIGEKGKLQCVVSGGPISSITWMKNGELIAERKTGGSGKVLEIESVDISSKGMYQCFVTNNMETKQASAQLSLLAIPPKLTRYFHNKIVRPGEQAILQCSATGDPLPRIVWKLRESVIYDHHKNFNIISKERANQEVTSTLKVWDVKSSDGGLYTCEARNSIGLTSHSEFIKIFGPPQVWPLANVTVVSGEQMKLFCHVSGYPIKKITWKKDGKRLRPNRRVEIYANGSLAIHSAEKDTDEGEFVCKAENNQGLSSIGKGNAVIIEKPLLVPVPEEIVLKAKRRLQLTCSISQGDPPITFQWLLNGQALPHDLELVVADSVLSSTLTGQRVNRRHSSNYSCEAKNIAGKALQNTNVLVKDSPEWNHKPKSHYQLSVSESINILCSGNGYPTPHAFWSISSGNDFILMKNSTRIKVSTDGTLTVRNIIDEDFAIYLCTVTNEFNPDLQQEVRLVRSSSITFLNHPNNFKKKQGEQLKLKCQVKSTKKVTINWTHGSKAINSKTNQRFKITEISTPIGSTSIAAMKNLSPRDSGFYVCQARHGTTINSTRFYVTVEESGKNSIIYIEGNKTVDLHSNGREILPNSTGLAGPYQLNGLALLYIVPTATAATILFGILIVVCILLHGQRRKQRKRRKNEIEMRKSWPQHHKEHNYKYVDSDKGSANYSKTSEAYYEIQPNRQLSEDHLHFYSPMSSSSNHPETGNIAPYATFRSCTDPVPPIPI